MKIGKIGELNEIESKHVHDVTSPMYEIEQEVEPSSTEGPDVHVESLRDTFRGLLSKNGDDEVADERCEEYIGFLEDSTPLELTESTASEVEDLSDDEIQDIWDNDPGYISELAIKPLGPSTGEETLDEHKLKNDGPYMTLGYHSLGTNDLVNYTDDAEEGSEEPATVSVGQIFVRYGSEAGSYLADDGVDFEDLQLPVSEDKLEKHRYEVVREFEVEKSCIASQPFDERGETKDGNSNTMQYKTSISIGDLVEMGFLRRLD